MAGSQRLYTTFKQVEANMSYRSYYINPGAYIHRRGRPSPHVRTTTPQPPSPLISPEISLSPHCYLPRGITESTSSTHNSPFSNAYSTPNSALSNVMLPESPPIPMQFHTAHGPSASPEAHFTVNPVLTSNDSLFGPDQGAFATMNHATMNNPTYPAYDVPLEDFEAALNSSMLPTGIEPSLFGNTQYQQHQHQYHTPTASTSYGHPSLGAQYQSSSSSASPTQHDSPHAPLTPIETQPTNGFTQQNQLIQEIRSSSWFRSNQPEPEDLPGQSIYLRFLKRISEAGTYRCLYRGCHRTFDRRDRALGHVRQHLNHRPFFCGGECFNGSCKERFFSAAYLRTHISRSKIQCDHCPAQIFPQNMRRHLKSCRGFKAKLPIR